MGLNELIVIGTGAALAVLAVRWLRRPADHVRTAVDRYGGRMALSAIDEAIRAVQDLDTSSSAAWPMFDAGAFDFKVRAVQRLRRLRAEVSEAASCSAATPPATAASASLNSAPAPGTGSRERPVGTRSPDAGDRSRAAAVAVGSETRLRRDGGADRASGAVASEQTS